MTKKTLKKIMRSPRFEPRIYGFKVNRGIHYAIEADEFIQININQYMLKLYIEKKFGCFRQRLCVLIYSYE